MNKAEFLSALRTKLAGLPEIDIKKSLAYYSEMIDDRIEDGMTEEAAVNDLGSIDEIASQIFMDTPLPKVVKATAQKKKSRGISVWELILLILGFPLWGPLIFAAVAVIFSVYIVIWSIVISLYAVDFAIAVSGVGMIVGCAILTLTGHPLSGVLVLGAGLICAGIAILLFFAFNLVTKGIIVISKAIVRGIKSLFVKGGC